MFIEMKAHAVDEEALSVELGTLLGDEGALSFEWELLSADGKPSSGE